MSNSWKHPCANDWEEYHHKHCEKSFFCYGDAVFGPCYVWVSAHNLLMASFCQRFLKNLSLPNEVKSTLILFCRGQESVDVYKRLDLDTGSVCGCLSTLFQVLLVPGVWESRSAGRWKPWGLCSGLSPVSPLTKRFWCRNNFSPAASRTALEDVNYTLYV